MKWLILLLYINIASCQQSSENGYDQFNVPPPISLDGGKLKSEVDSLNENRAKNIENLMNVLSVSCMEKHLDVWIVQINVKPNGEVKDYKTLKSNDENNSFTRATFDCFNEKLEKRDLNLGEIKVTPNARNGTKPQDVLYSFPIKKQ